MTKDQFFSIIQDIYSFYLWIECVANETHLNLYETPIEAFADQMVRRVAENFPDTEHVIDLIFHWFWVDFCSADKMDELWNEINPEDN